MYFAALENTEKIKIKIYIIIIKLSVQFVYQLNKRNSSGVVLKKCIQCLWYNVEIKKICGYIFKIMIWWHSTEYI